jgi:type IV pilus assembly protein PilB
VVFDASGPPPGSSGEARRPLLGELLVQAKVVTSEQLAQALAAQVEPVNDKKIGQLLIERGWITEAQLTQTLSLQLSVPWVSLYHIDFSRQLLNRVQRDLAERHCLVPIFVRHVKGQGETLYVAMDDPTNDAALQEVSRQANLPTRPMIASATDIRSAIRVYYGEPEGPQIIDVPATPPRLEPPTTTREGMRRDVAPATPQVATQPDPWPHRGSQPPRAPSPPPPVDADAPPPTTRSNPPPAAAARNPLGRAAVLAAAVGAEPPGPSSRRADPSTQVRSEDRGQGGVPRDEPSEQRRSRSKTLSLTLLDGTTLSLPAKAKAAGPEGLTARDFVSALRATAHGADATEILGEMPQWEPVVAALLSILLRKGLIADWEFVEELRKI